MIPVLHQPLSHEERGFGIGFRDIPICAIVSVESLALYLCWWPVLKTERVGFLFADARGLYEETLEMLEEGPLRNAADKAWGATKRATDAVILARTGEEPRTSGQAMRMIRQLRRQDPALEPMRQRYATRQSFLHGACFYDGILEPEGDIIADVRENLEYIQEAKAMVQV